MGVVFQKDKRSGITYAYENKAYWDKDKKQSRSKRTLIGRLDPDTGDIIPTDGRCRHVNDGSEESLLRKELNKKTKKELVDEIIRLRGLYGKE